LSNGTILISGMIAGDPDQGGASWSILQYVLGFRRLGYETVVVEPVNQLRTGSVAYLQKLRARFSFEAGLLTRGSRETAGISYRRILETARRADVLINVSGMLSEPELMEPIASRVYLDLDPAFNQLWHEACGIDMRLDGHTHFVTVGQAIGRPGCSVPTCGRQWIPTVPPVVLEEWPLAPSSRRAPVTTVGNWRGYGSIEHGGLRYGQKAHSLRTLLDLPSRSSERLLLALAIDPDETPDLNALAANGWKLADPSRVARTPGLYRRFIQRSKAELGLAKSGYVLSRCGWFSDRSACYLASGKPVIAQATGFEEHLPTGQGLLAFTTTEEAAEALEAVDRDYGHQRGSARAIAEEHFDSDRVLASLLDRL
jgi:hypothetical protein